MAQSQSFSLIHELQRSLCLSSSIPLHSPPCITVESNGGEGEEEGKEREIKFGETLACGFLLTSLGLDPSDPVSIGSELSEQASKGRNQPKNSTVLLSDVLDIKLRLSSQNETTNRVQTGLKDEPICLNLSGVDIDSIFKETKKEIASNQVTARLKNQTSVNTPKSTINLVKAVSGQSFAKWEADFQPENETESPSVENRVDGVKIGHSKPNSMDKLPVSPIELSDQAGNLSLDNDDFDDWNNFAGSSVAQTEEKKEPFSSEALPVEIINRSDNREALNAEKLSVNGDDFDDWNNFAGSAVAQSEEIKESCSNNPLDEEKINRSDNNAEALNAEKLSLDNVDFDDWNNFAGSAVAQTEEKKEPFSSEALPVEIINRSDNRDALNAEKLSVNCDGFDDWNNFAGSAVAQSEEIKESCSGDTLPVESINRSDNNVEALNAEFDHQKDFTSSQNEFGKKSGPNSTDDKDVLNGNSEFDDWNDFASPNINQSDNLEVFNAEFHDKDFTQSKNEDTVEKAGPGSLESKEILNDNAEFDDWNDFTGSNAIQIQTEFPAPVEKTGSISLDSLPVMNIESSDNPKGLIANGDDLFDDWKDFSGQTGSTGQDEKTGPVSVDPLNLNQQQALNAEFDDWKDLTKSNVGQSQTIQPSDDLFEDWKGFATSSQTTEQNPKNQTDDVATGDWSTAEDWQEFANSNQTTEQNPKSQTDDVALGDWSSVFDAGLRAAIDASVDQSDEWLGLERPTELMERLASKTEPVLNSTDDWMDFVQSDPNSVPPNPNSVTDGSNLSKDSKSEEKDLGDLFDDWQNFTGSDQLKKSESDSKEDNLNLGLNFWESGNKTTDLGSESKGLSDDWLGFTIGSTSSQVKGNNSTELMGKNNENSDDWMDLWKSSTSQSEGIKSEEIKKENYAGSNNWQDNFDSLNRRIETNGDLPNDLTLSKSKSDVEKFLSQMTDLSFMLKDELSIPNKSNAK